MKQRVEDRDCLIIRKNGRYLVGRSPVTDRLRWSWSAYDAWRTKDPEIAGLVAQYCGGVILQFNPIVARAVVYA